MTKALSQRITQFSQSGLKITCLALLACCMSACYYDTPTTRYMDIANADRSTIKTRHTLDYYLQMYPNEEAVYDLVEETLEDYGSIDETKPYVHSRHSKIIVLDSAFGKRNDRYNLEYQEWRRLSNFLLLVRDPDGTMHEYDFDKLKTSITKDGIRHYQLQYPRLKRGTIMEFFIETSARSAIGGQIMTISQPNVCDSLHLFIVADKNRELRWKRTIQDVDYKLTKVPSTDKKLVVYEYGESHISPVYAENYCEPRLNASRYIQPRYADEVISWWQPSLEQFHNYYSKRVPKPSDLVNDTLVTLSMNLTKYCTQPKQALDSILLWVQNNIKIDETNYTDGNENYYDVLKDKFGSASIVTGLTEALLKIANIPSEYLLVRQRGFGLFDTHFLQHDEFTTLALRVPVDADSTFLVFPAGKSIPYNEQPWWIENRAILIHRNIDSTRFITLDKPNKVFDKRDTHYQIAQNQDSSAAVTLSYIWSGTSARYLRAELKDALKFTEREIRDVLLDHCDIPWTLSEKEREDAKGEYENLYDPHKPLVVHVKFNIANIFALTDILQREEPFGRLLNLDYASDSSLYNGARHGKIFNLLPREYKCKVDVTLPDTWRHTAMADQRKAQSMLGMTTVDVEANAGGFTLTRNEVLNDGTFEASLYKDLYEQLSPFSATNELKPLLHKRR